jgi:hypothetical protein
MLTIFTDPNLISNIQLNTHLSVGGICSKQMLVDYALVSFI